MPRAKLKIVPPPVQTPVEVMGEILREYGTRGVFKGVSDAMKHRGKPMFRMLWHYGQVFDLLIDEAAGTLSFPVLLPKVPGKSAMYRDLDSFIGKFWTDAVPEHRRVDERRAIYRLGTTRAGHVSLTMSVGDGDWEYAIRKLIHVVHEIFIVFLNDGPYYEYRIEKLGLDPDVVWA